MSKYVPSEIQEEILKRLPVKPLIRFRSVSKPWKSLIDSPEFTAAYGVRQTHPNRLILTYKHNADYEERYSMFVDNDDDHTFTRQDFAPKVPDPIMKFKGESHAIGSSNGLLCFDCYDHYGIEIVVLWNLSISKSICIEVPYIHDQEDEDVICIGVNHFIGFGVCPVVFDPTIVKIEYMNSDGFPWKVGVFTLSTGTWSILSTELPRESITLRGSHVATNSSIYWVAFDTLAHQDGRSRYLIMSFDLTAKEFKEINLTNSLTNQLRSILTISKLRESLVLLAYHTENEEDKSVCSLWKMMELGVSRLFTKLYNINLPHATIERLLGFWKTGELILKPQRFKPDSEFQIYDPNSEAIGNLGIGGDSYHFFMCSDEETLLLHDQLDGFIYSFRYYSGT